LKLIRREHPERGKNPTGPSEKKITLWKENLPEGSIYCRSRRRLQVLRTYGFPAVCLSALGGTIKQFRKFFACGLGKITVTTEIFLFDEILDSTLIS
jgi:hypothetical protein